MRALSTLSFASLAMKSLHGVATAFTVPRSYNRGLSHAALSSKATEISPELKRNNELKKFTSTSLDTTGFLNAAVLGSLFIASVYAIFHHDAEKLVALPVNADHAKAAVAMLHDLPTEWLAWYDDEALKYPLMTKASTSGICYSVGDIFAQGLAGKNVKTLDLGRTARSGAAGFIGHGPVAHYWLNFLDKFLSFNGAWWSVIPKIAIDQGPMSIVYNTIYSLLLGAFAFRDPRDVMRDVRAAFIPGFVASIRFWPLVHLVTFTVIPLELQLLWVDVAEIIWVCILSGVNNEKLNSDNMDESKA
mmetsp:Transcript_12450/g.15592  ORF Transcript_12450/g.15592 Transcript_12450/m.15592 type:complete len:303 (-) Transcript_12450:63-971(-)|eukprot:CAMPEP_0172515474 /NCGR_PEP_ID=MMETSP1066-20121228/268332_1 /TAXON_ID=671091 /ORGANISM="Coscinodiscus wailesii, Strain CCMP2513" /LENGTH=302 /DNA_ID=CAMNT_0013296537 /DNA_START=76 /DNA_END=984 /DNA_ORIENTATION=-